MNRANEYIYYAQLNIDPYIFQDITIQSFRHHMQRGIIELEDFIIRYFNSELTHRQIRPQEFPTYFQEEMLDIIALCETKQSTIDPNLSGTNLNRYFQKIIKDLKDILKRNFSKEVYDTPSATSESTEQTENIEHDHETTNSPTILEQSELDGYSLLEQSIMNNPDLTKTQKSQLIQAVRTDYENQVTNHHHK